MFDTFAAYIVWADGSRNFLGYCHSPAAAQKLWRELLHSGNKIIVEQF